MKPYNLLLIILTIVLFLSCKKSELYEPVTSEITLNFLDSSMHNPKNSDYQNLLDKYVRIGLPGIVALVKTKQNGLWVGASGYSRIEDKTPMTKGAILYSASVAKTYTAVAVLQLVEEGLINLDDKMNVYLSKEICDNIPNGNKVTVKQLLKHTSGIPNNDFNTKIIATILNDPFSLTPKDNITCEYGKKPLFEPDNGFEYSSTGYELLSIIIDNVTRENHGKYFTSHIFKPLDLRNTYYKNEPEYPHPQGLVNSYFDRLGDGKIENVSPVENHLVSIYAGGDGMMASIYDYYLFIEGLFTGKLLNPESFEKMTTWTNTSVEGRYYGLGLMKRQTKYGFKMGHTGTGMACGIDMYYFPEADVYVVTATNVSTFLDTKLSLKYIDFQNDLFDVIFK